MDALSAIVIGAGQAGLSAAWHLQRLGLSCERDYIVLDANAGPGGAWRHRCPSLTFDAAHGLHDLPGLPLGVPDPAEPASAVVARYYGAYERRFGLPVHRPERVTAVEDAGGLLRVRSSGGERLARAVINGTGTWDRPYWPWYPGRGDFRGRQLHTHDFRSAEEFRGQRVLVIGGGTSALQFLLQLDAAGARTLWSTRRPPEFTSAPFDAAWGIDVGPGRRNQPRKAVFQFEKPVGYPPGTVFKFYLTQNHGGWNSDDNQNHNLGRFRLSVTTKLGAEADPLPERVRKLLTVPPEQRWEAVIDLTVENEESARGLFGVALDHASHVSAVSTLRIAEQYEFIRGGKPTNVGIRGYPLVKLIDDVGATYQNDPAVLKFVYDKDVAPD